jgi:hypothetical protein
VVIDLHEIADWNGRQISVARSPGGTLLLCDTYAGLIRPRGVPWPPPALVMKLGEGDARHPFASELHARVSGALGHYCALQSINSEDAITWSFFGPLMLAADSARTTFLNWLCEKLALPTTQNNCCTIDLWRRIPHPQKPAAPGPELDAVVDGDQVVVFVEAKWRSPEGIGQGPQGTATQMQLRREFFERWGTGLYAGRGMVVLGLTLGDPIAAVAESDEREVAVSSLTWDALAGYEQHPNGDEFARYLSWKRMHSLAPRPAPDR